MARQELFRHTQPRPGRQSALLSLRLGAGGPAHRAAVPAVAFPARPARPGRLVSRRRRLPHSRPGQHGGLLDGRGRSGRHSDDRHQLRPAVSVEGALAGALGQTGARALRRLEPSSQRRCQSDPLRRTQMEARHDLAGVRPAAGQRRGSPAIAGALSVRQPRPRARRARETQGACPKAAQTTSTAADSSLPRATAAGRTARSSTRASAQLMQEVFPEPEYKLRLLEAEHPIWYAEEKIDASQLRPLWGIEFGCRTSVVYVPPDPPQNPRPALSCLWELSRPGAARNTPGPSSRKSTPRSRWASTCWPMPRIGN